MIDRPNRMVRPHFQAGGTAKYGFDLLARHPHLEFLERLKRNGTALRWLEQKRGNIHCQSKDSKRSH